MELRINDGPYFEGLFEDNFILNGHDGNAYPFSVHRLKPDSENYEQVMSVRMGVKPGSAAEKCANGLIWNCGHIEVLEMSHGKYVACFRDSKVQVSRYLGVNDFQEHLDQWLQSR